MIMRKAIRWFGIAIFSCLLGSCNLFIDDEIEDGDNNGGFKNVPEHSGKGYDEAVTVQDGDCEVTYRLKKNVRHVEDDQLKYITHVKHDETGLLMEVHYSGDTPKELLPVPGEILHCTNTDKFEWGCNHLVQTRTDADGVHKYLLTFAKLDETFEELEINGSLISEDYEESYTVPAEPLDDETVEDVAGTRGGGGGNDEFGVEIVDNSFSLTIPLGFETKIQFDHGLYCTINTKGSYFKVTNTFNFDGFSLDNMKAQLVQDVEEVCQMTVAGGLEGSKRLKRWKPIKGKVIVAGPVVLVLFMNVDLSIEGSVEASLSLEKEEHIIYTYNIDFRNQTCKKAKEPIRVTDWGLSVQVAGNAGLRLALQLGIGIYGKVLSVRVIPSLYVGFEAKLPIISYKKSDGVTYDIKDGLGVTFKALVDLEIGAFLDLSLRALLGDEIVDGLEALKGQLDKLTDLANGDNEVYRELANTTPTEDLNDVMNDKNNDQGVTTKLATWTIFQYHLPWFPKIKDKSFKVKKSWDSNKKKMSFRAEYKIEKEGFFVALGSKYVPALQIKDGSTVITTLFPDEGGNDAIVKKGSTYRFTIGENKDDITYTAIPCYYSRPISRFEPDALDKGLPFCATSPMIAIEDAVMTDYTTGSKGGYGNDRSYKYDYMFKVKTYTSIIGLANMEDWGILEEKSKTDLHRGKASQDDDGTYVMNWTFHKYSNYDGVQSVETVFRPSFWIRLSDKKGDTKKVDGSPYIIEFFSNGDIKMVGSRKPSNYTSFQGTRDKESQTVGYLESIEKDGKVIWQR